ncbi:MAG: hypothetical protein GY756_12375, partial [bacterium]|nr:hypothetical protein [bacterium]
GGKILPCAEVTKILLEEDIAMGVEYKDGYSGDKMKTFKAEAVIANSNIPDTIFKLLPREKVPLDYKKKINEYETSQSIFCLWLGLNEDISKKVEGYEIFLYNTPNDDEDLKAINTCDPVEVSCSIINYNNAYNGYTNESGTSVLGIFFPCSYEPWREFEEDYFNGNKESYNKKKDFITDVLIKRVEESILPGLREMIKVKEAATPLTIVRYTDNKDGAILGYRQTLNNYGQKRIKDSPFKGLYYSSAWGLPGGGYNGVLWGGYAAVYELLNDLLNEEE